MQLVIGRIGRAHGIQGQVGVEVRAREQRRGKVLEVRVHPEDLGKVIGRMGRTAKALRTVMSALGGTSVRVDLVDVDGGR